MEICMYRSKEMSLIVVFFLIWVLPSSCTTGVHSKEQSLGSKSETFREAERHYNAGDYELALDLFIKAEKSEPTNWFTYNRIGWTYFYLLKNQDAIFQFNKSIARLVMHNLFMIGPYHQLAENMLPLESNFCLIIVQPY